MNILKRLSHLAIVEILKKNIRLKGAIYADGFKGLSQRPHIIKSMQEDYERLSDSRRNRDLMIWRKGMDIKKEYNQALYGDIETPDPLELCISFNEETKVAIGATALKRPDSPRP